MAAILMTIRVYTVELRITFTTHCLFTTRQFLEETKMKKLLLASVAVSGLAFAAPAHADIDLEVGGYFKGYGVFVDSDTANERDFDFIRDTELHIGGETTLDNGLTVGAHFEFDVDGADSNARQLYSIRSNHE